MRREMHFLALLLLLWTICAQGLGAGGDLQESDQCPTGNCGNDSMASEVKEAEMDDVDDDLFVEDFIKEMAEDDAEDVEVEALEAQDLEMQQENGAETEEVQEVKEVAWEDITGNLTIVRPAPGSEVEGSAVVVQLNVNTNTPNVTKFEEKFNHSNICISMDEAPFSCWPIMGLSKFPLFTNMSAGLHQVVAKLVDPKTGEFLLEESYAMSDFTVIPKPEEEKKDEEEEEEDDEEDDETDPEKKKKKEKETIPIPSVGVEYPSDNMAVPGTFDVRLSVITNANITLFRRLMQDSFICIALDNVSFQSCWPIFEENYYPKYFDVKPGHHTIIAHLLHPNTLEIIPGTAQSPREFWVTERNTGMIPMTLKEPSKGSNAFPEELKRQVLEEIAKEQLARELKQNEEEEAKEKEIAEDAAKTTSSRKDSSSSEISAGIQQQRETEQKKSTNKKNDRADSKVKKMQEPVLHDSETNVPFIQLQINVDGKRHSLRVEKDDDYVDAAAKFCIENRVSGHSCVTSIHRLIQIEWQKYELIPHIELFTSTD